MDSKSFHGKAVAAIGAVTMVSAVAGTATALQFTSLEAPAFDLFGARTEDTAFSVTDLQVRLQGQDKVTVKVTAQNREAAAHAANVTVQLRDEADAVLVEATKATGSVGAGESFRDTWRFQQSDLARDYDDVFLWFDQTS